jgi:hypothetical protein
MASETGRRDKNESLYFSVVEMSKGRMLASPNVAEGKSEDRNSDVGPRIPLPDLHLYTGGRHKVASEYGVAELWPNSTGREE